MTKQSYANTLQTVVDRLSQPYHNENIDSDTCCLFLEIVTNPQMEVADLAAISKIAHAHNVPLLADTTIIPFTKFSAKDLGVDVELVSSTKYITGGATSLGGLLIDYGYIPCLKDRVRNETLINLGSIMTPHAAYMQTVGLETLDARYERQSANTLWIAEQLEENKISVNYPGLRSNPFHELAKQQFGDTYGAMLTIDLESKEQCFNFLNKLRLVKRATNLFDNRSLAIHPASTIFGFFAPHQLKKMDVRDTTIRLSIGLEAKEDVLEDLLRERE